MCRSFPGASTPPAGSKINPDTFSSPPAYLLAALIVLARYRPRQLRIEGDFGVIERPVFLASAANTSSYGGSVPIAPAAVPTDGLLDLCIIEGMVVSKALALIPAIFRGRHVGHPKVQFVRTRQVRIDADEPLELWADGQRIARTPVTIEAVPGAIEVIVP
jgi:diacylglycerol kinase (ATP)